MRLRSAIACCAPLLALAACGDEPSDPSSSAAGWEAQHLAGDPAVDFPTLLATAGDDALVLFLAEDGTLRSYLSEDGADFAAGDPLPTGEKYVALGGVVRVDGGWYALGSGGTARVDGDDEMLFEPLAFRSVDGSTWERVEVGGFSDAVEFNDVEVVDGAIVAAGSYRTLRRPADGGFEARAWISEDGTTFDEVTLPGVPDYRGYDDESYVGDIVATDDALVASGRVGRSAALWRSADGGRTWTGVDDPVLASAYSISAMHADGSTVVATVGSTDTAAIRSDDGGRTWAPVGALPVNEETEGWAPLWAGGGRFFTLTGIDDTSWSEPEVCYADLDQCGRSPEPSLVASDDGSDWTTVDTRGLGEIDQVAGLGDGRLLVMTGEGEGRTVHTWPAGDDLPVAEQPALPETVELVTLAEGEEPETGVRYHHPLYTHCGIDWVWFGDTTWRRTDDGPDYETGAGDEAPDGWPVPPDGGNVFGYATVLGDGTLEYTDEDGSVLATYEERSGAPGCD